MSLSQLIQSWRKFWFEPQSPTPVALFRILYGLLILEMALVEVGGHFLTWYGKNAVIPFDAVRHYFWHDEPRFDLLLLLPPDDNWFIAFFVLFIVAAFFLSIGFCTRASAVFVCLSMISLHHHDPFNINGGDSFLKLAGIWLCMSNCPDALSVDQLIARRLGKPKPPWKAPWATRMIQIQVAIVYCQTFFCKISGTQWLDATAVYYATRLDDIIRFPMPFTDNFVILRILSWYTLIVEFSMWTIVWIREVRYYVLAATALLHFGLDLTLNLPVFEWAFISALITFIEPADLDRFLESMKLKASAQLSKKLSVAQAE